MPQNVVTEIWLTITNVRLRAAAGEGAVDVQVQGDAGEAADQGPKWLKCKECTPPPARDEPDIKADKLYDKILEALQKNRKVRGLLKCYEVKSGGDKNQCCELMIEEVQVLYQ